MKIQKTQLKAIIKECLLEILTEGLGSPLTESVQQARQAAPTRKVPAGQLGQPRKPPFDPALDRPAVAVPKTGNPMIDSILAESASNLGSLLKNDPSLYGTEGGPVHSGGGVPLPSVTEDLFGEGMASNWMALLDATEKNSQ